MRKGLSGSIDTASSHLDQIVSRNVRDAFLYLIGHAAVLKDWRCEADWHGDICDFRYCHGTEQPFAFIPNQESLLWYCRHAGLLHPAANISWLREDFEDVAENSRGEIEVRICNLTDAVKLIEIVFGGGNQI